ncbi:hypothetical protein M0638_13095 [Roseomonas sp. NAR14]|uniref:Uncharacterized protein n=1 Tax=Roseomonas acroporae TaxID=2937791 RepID=A0A9X2BVQ4_9PROT|nr:hypothetical protein [Roseomonas acroporae]MCK8785321.1 hypothetical protein [Roseomonas acroporae]
MLKTTRRLALAMAVLTGFNAAAGGAMAQQMGMLPLKPGAQQPYAAPAPQYAPQQYGMQPQGGQYQGGQYQAPGGYAALPGKPGQEGNQGGQWGGGAPQPGPVAQGPAARGPVTAGADWVSWTGENGLQLLHPPGWRVTATPENWVIMQGDGNRSIAFRYFGGDGGVDAREIGPVMANVVQQIASQQDWGQPEAYRENALRMVGRGNGRLGLARLSWLTQDNRSEALISIIAAPPGQVFDETAGVLEGVLRSVRNGPGV